MNSNNNYSLLDSGDGQKLEKVGKYTIIRPSAVAIWQPALSKDIWDRADAIFSRDTENKWVFKRKIPSSWNVIIKDIDFKLSVTDFGHLGIFPEHATLFDYIEKKIKERKSFNLLNLFAYTGGVTFAAAKAGAKVCHLDASTKAIVWAKENASLNNLENAPIRYIVDDVTKFLKREMRRGVKYDAIVLDPPSFGRGKSGQVFKIERDLFTLLENCRDLLSDNPSFIILSCHTPGITASVLSNISSQVFKDKDGALKSGEMCLKAEDKGMSIPSGSFLIWEPK